MKQEYYCDIPWRQIWREDHEWFQQQQKRNPTYEEELANIQAVCTETIPWPLPWNKIWKTLKEWMRKEIHISWEKEKRKIQQLVQQAANKAVNKDDA